MDYTDTNYRINNNDYEDQIRLHGDLKLKELQVRETKDKGRNFAWEGQDTKNKT